jgi:transcriptional regulator with XRE-family HTH domain
MARMNPLPDRERVICARLRSFRELHLGMSRVAVARRLGIDSSRLASYELGRVPLRFEVFLAVHRQYFLNPVWLATGEEQQAFDAPIDWGIIASFAIPRRWLFTETYDRALERYCKDRNRLADVLAGRIVESVSRLIDLAKEHRNVGVTSEIAFRLRERLKDLDAFLESFSRLQLTEKSKLRKLSEVHVPTLKELLDQIRGIVKPSGMKAALASYLGVPQSRVSEWLGGKHEPSGEVALKLLKWVSDPALKQTTLDTAKNSTKGKTRVHKSKSYEKANSNPQER